jgi:4-amino-4-deoxy-L-arabinose transferase-like glycosyltransferase
LTEPPGAKPGAETWQRPPRWSRLEATALAAIMAIAAALRFHDYTAAPSLSDNQDPLQFAWSGLTLITKGVPYSWEVMSAYHVDFRLFANGTHYDIVHPWLSHPPLLSLLTGGWVYLLGARGLTDVTAQMVRPVGIVLGLVAALLAYLLGRRILDRPAALIGVLLLAVTPGAVLLGREVETEALLAPLLLLSLLMVHRIQTGPRRWPAIATLLACAVLLPLTKVTGLVLGASIAVVLLSLGHWRLALAELAGTIGGLGLYFGYAAVFDLNLFLAVLREWSGHRHGVMAGLEFVTDNAGIGSTLHDGVWHLGWLGAAALLLRERLGPRAQILAWTLVAYAAGITVLGDPTVQGRYGWYRIVLYPLVYLAGGFVCWEVIRRPSAPGLLLIMVLVGAGAMEMALGSQWQPDAFLLILFLALLLIPSALALWRKESEFWGAAAEATTAASLTLIVLASLFTSLSLGQVYQSL